MKSLDEIYNSISKNFFDRTDIDIEEGTVIDFYNLAVSDVIKEIYDEVEKNKTPHIYSNLSGENLDNMGILLGISRRPNESDKNYLYRILNWNISNKASNSTAIETALMNMTHASHVTYAPHVFGCGTAVAYVIPKEMTEAGKNLALAETKSRLKNIVSPSSYIEYIVPSIIQVKLVLLIKSESPDLVSIKKSISNKIIDYINKIAPGDYLEVGNINKIGINEPNINYFSVGHLFINGEETGKLSILQKIESKFLISDIDITWLEVE